MARDRDYRKLLGDLKGKTVSVWTCSTCARLCYGLGGKDSAERLAIRLRDDGVDVRDVGSTSAGCIVSKLRQKEGFGKGSDIIVSLTCNTGAICAKDTFRIEVMNPVVTYGQGFLSEDGTPVLVTENDGITSKTELTELCRNIAPDTAGFV